MSHEKSHRNTQLLQAYESGSKPESLAEEFGICSQRVLAIVRRDGGRMNPRGRPRTVVSAREREKVGQLYSTGMSLAEVSQATSLTHWVVRRILGESGAISAPKGVSRLS